MVFLIILSVVAVSVAVVALQNGQAATVSLLVWQFEAPVALVVLIPTAAGLVIGGLTGFVLAVRRRSPREAAPAVTYSPGGKADPPRTVRDLGSPR